MTVPPHAIATIDRRPGEGSRLEAERAVSSSARRRLSDADRRSRGVDRRLARRWPRSCVSLDGSRRSRAEHAGSATDADGVGTAVADDCLAGGAAEILADVQRHTRRSKASNRDERPAVLL